MLARLLLDPGGEFSVRQLAEFADTSPPTALREVDRLVAAGILTERRIGRTRLVQANRSHPVAQQLAAVVAYAYGPLSVLPRVLKGVAGVDSAFVFGSWARRFTGQPGPDPNDVDVILVGAPPRDAVYQAARQATEQIGREVNPTVVSAERWALQPDGFVKTVRAGPLVEIPIDGPGNP
ncbi:MAG: ArsR family transcriptional regulator [Bifidobacteriaceae bacterium]|nr:ArsR family transcriptional regulator [Bifidobacteriaceae bacterium]